MCIYAEGKRSSCADDNIGQLTLANLFFYFNYFAPFRRMRMEIFVLPLILLLLIFQKFTAATQCILIRMGTNIFSVLLFFQFWPVSAIVVERKIIY